MKKTLKLITSIILLAALAFTACSGREKQKDIPSALPETSAASDTAALALSENEESSEQPQLLAAHENEEEPQKKNKDIVILATSDVHCSPQRNFGYTSLYRIREKFLKEGCEVILVDNGDEVEGHGEMFGTVTRGKQVILEIDVKGAFQVRKLVPEAVLIFIEPPSLEELRRRLEGRGTEDAETIERRMKTAEWELSQKGAYDMQLVNDDLEAATDELVAFVNKCADE